MIIKDEIQRYLTSPDITGLADASQKAYGYSLGHLREYCKRTSIHSISELKPKMPLFARWLKQSRKITDQSVQQHINNVKIFLNWLGHPVEYSYRISNHDKQARKKKHSKRWLSENEVAMCLNYPFENASTTVNKIKYKLIVRLLVETGCRAKELACLDAADVDIDNQTLYLATSKTEPRPAFFSPLARELFLQLKKKVSWRGNLFPSVDRIKQIVNEMLVDLKLKNGKDGRGPHCFRHYFASYLFFVGGMRIEEVAILMGDTVEVVRSLYLHCPEMLLREKITDAMGWKL